MARKQKAALADLRALEEQSERANPIAPSTKRKQVTGGRRTKKTPSLAVLEKKEKPSLHNAMEDEMAMMPSGEYDGAGKHTLMDHLAAPMKGFGDYLHAFETAGKEEAPAPAKAKKILPGATRKGGMKTGKYEGEGATPSMGLSQFRGGVKHQHSSPAESIRGGMAMGQMVGSGKKAAKAKEPETMSEASEEDMAEAVGGAKPARKKRAPAGPSDGRRKRAEIVRKVMAEKGLSMIAASKYVREHGLYTPSK